MIKSIFVLSITSITGKLKTKINKIGNSLLYFKLKILNDITYKNKKLIIIGK